MMSFSSNTLNRDWRYRVYLPISYLKETNNYYEILYLLHGHGGSEVDWTDYGSIDKTLDRLCNEGKIREIIVVMPDGGNSWYVDGTEKMETAIIQDLIPKVEKDYRVKAGRENRSIGGMSAGGYGSLRFILKYPDLFKNAILMSPAAYYPVPDNNSSARTGVASFRTNGVYSDDVWKSYNYDNYWNIFDAATNKPHNFYLSVGTSDAFPGIINAVNVQLSNALSARSNKVSVDIKNYAGGHVMSVWQQAIEYAVLQIYKK